MDKNLLKSKKVRKKGNIYRVDSKKDSELSLSFAFILKIYDLNL